MDQETRFYILPIPTHPTVSFGVCPKRDEVLNIKVFNHNHVVLVDKLPSDPIEASLPSTPQFQTSAGKGLTSLLSSARPHLLGGETTLSIPKSQLLGLEGFQISKHLSLGSDSLFLEANINTSGLTCFWEMFLVRYFAR